MRLAYSEDYANVIATAIDWFDCRWLRQSKGLAENDLLEDFLGRPNPGNVAETEVPAQLSALKVVRPVNRRGARWRTCSPTELYRCRIEICAAINVQHEVFSVVQGTVHGTIKETGFNA